MTPQVEIHLMGGYSVRPFGLLVVLGLLFGYFLARARAREQGIDGHEFGPLVAWTVGTGLVSAHVIDVVFYHPEELARGPLYLLEFWTSLSSIGGLAGACVASLVFAWRSGRPWRQYADVLLQGWVLGWVFGRLGCTLAFDHPGAPTTAFLAFRYLDGQLRHNLGFYEFLYTLAIMLPATLLLHRARPQAPGGAQTVLAVLLYAPFRFLLDFLRATDVSGADPRYGGLTAAQWGFLAFFLLVVPFAAGLRAVGSGQPEEKPI
ncbi:MAG: prolipoprotein diacylglyceryl transferase [Candidatus Sericytochromatia bacterium]|nr:prolipoprotein diacylglyceryl transferase [Candidatus Tanganyikabacteria bacterium]